MARRSRRHMRAEDLYRFHLITECTISPNGRDVLYAVQRIDRKKEKSYCNLWLAASDGSENRQFTYGDHVDSNPRWSPDGRTIAFLSNRGSERQSQIFLIPRHGGEARQLSKLEGSFGEIVWSPDGSKILCTFRKKDEEEIQREKSERKKKLGIVSRQIDRVFYKLDGEGYRPKNRRHLWVVQARSGKAEQLTDHELSDDWDPCWSPDGRSIVFSSNRSVDPDLDPDVYDLFVVPADGGPLERIPTPLGPKGRPSVSPDGKWIAYVGHEGRGDWWKHDHVMIVPFDGSQPVRNLTGAHDIHVSSWTINDLGSPVMRAPTWANDGSRIYFQTTIHGDTVLRSVSTDDATMETVIGERGVVGAFSLDRDQSFLAYVHGTMSDPGQIHIRNMKTRRTRQLTRLNRRLLNAIDLGDVEEVWIKGASDNDLQGWIIRPPDFDHHASYPSILEIHGGPLVQYGNYMMHEFFYLAAQGYVVHFCNPRGGRGYGEEHAKAIWCGWGTVDYEDLMAWTDHVEALPFVDSARMGVTGGSYGGYMTNWIIGHTPRFKAAVTQRSVSNLTSMWGSSDYNWVFQEEIGGRTPWEDIEEYWARSPMKYIGNAQTPTLVIHSEQDLRCAMEQGEQVYIALKKLGVDTELVLFPSEPHGLSRGGRTDRRIARLSHIVRWFQKYL